MPYNNLTGTNQHQNMNTPTNQIAVSSLISKLDYGDIDYYVCLHPDGTLSLDRKPSDTVILTPDKLHDLRAIAYHNNQPFTFTVHRALDRRLASIR